MPSFGQWDGLVYTLFGMDRGGRPHDVAILGNGRIVVVGESDGDFALTRYNPDGSLSTTFDGDGTVTTTVSAPGECGGRGGVGRW